MLDKSLIINRSLDDINSLVQVMVDSYFSTIDKKQNKRETRIIDKLKSLEVKVQPQFMHIFESPLDKIHFKDIINQLTLPIINEHIEVAHTKGILTDEEHYLIRLILSKNQ